ncbi:MAG: GNAT family N-acetyltransferase [Lachnospiraceae bacterium]|nr:GNAT family N-acetyltransferase [Lachnospiraceae bacterium]
MLDIYKSCPILENENFLLRLIEEKDAEDLLKIYSDKAALPFFNSDNCHGSNFYITNEKDMINTIKYWRIEYSEGGFVRFTIIDKGRNSAIGTIELFNRKANDYFNNCGLLRIDLHPDYENTEIIADILSIIVEPAYELFDCTMIAMKAPIYAVDRIEALQKSEFMLTEEHLTGSYGGKEYYDYWIKFK